jgi:drug/metabolite transporter (DMT)-like permease
MTGFMIAIYTTLDAYGIRQAEDPFTFLAWFFFMGGFGFPVIAWFRMRRLASLPSYRDLLIRGFTGAIVAYVSFGAVMLATRLGKVGEAAALRETSIIFATAIGVFIFKERINATRVAIIALIAAGAVLVEFG